MKIFTALLLLASALFAKSAPGPAYVAPDTNKIHGIYLDGDFDQAIGMTEGWLASKSRMTHADSVFAFKHLGVMYAARNDTREKGKYYMLRLLEVEPTARILDMYASDMIYMIFKNIREEYEANRVKLTRAEGHVEGNGQPRPTTASQAAEPMPAQPTPAAQPRRREEPAAKKSESGGGHAIYWVGGAALLVGAGVATYFILDSQPTTHKVVYGVE